MSEVRKIIVTRGLPRVVNLKNAAGATGAAGTAGAFTDLSDTPASYAGESLKVIRVNAGETALETTTLAGGGDALTTDPLSQFAATTSAQLAGVLSDETGTGAAVFANTPTLVTPELGAATGTSLTLTAISAIDLGGVGQVINCNGIELENTGTIFAGGASIGIAGASPNRGFIISPEGSGTTLEVSGDTTIGGNLTVNGGTSFQIIDDTGTAQIKDAAGSAFAPVRLSKVEFGSSATDPAFQNNAGVIEAKDKQDTNYKDFKAANITTDSGTVDGRDVAADGTKLDGIEAGANVTDTANVSASGAAMAANNLSDLINAGTARTNIGLGAFNAATFLSLTTGTISASTITTSGNIELGNASDTTLSRAAAGILAVEGSNIPRITTGAGAPSSTPTIEGEVYVDTTGDDVYIAAGTASSADWKNTTGAGGGGMVTGISKNSGANVNAANRSVLNFIEGSGISLTIADDSGGDEVDITITSSAGGGNVSNSGTPVNDQIAVWTDANTIEGTSGLTFAAGTLTATTFAGNLTGDVTGNCSGTAATVTGAAQAAITSVGTLTTLDVDNLNVNGNTITATTGAVNITPAAGSAIVLDGTINVDAGVVTGATSITSTAFVGALTGNADTATSATSATTATTANNLAADGVDALTEIAQSIKTAADDTSKLAVGTAGTTNQIASWDANGALQGTSAPVLGTPASGTLTNCTGLPAAGVVGTALTKAQEFTKSITIEDPTSSEDITIWYTKSAITLTEVHAVLPNGTATPTVTYQIKHHTDRSNAGNAGTTSAAVTSITTGTDATLSDATIPADSFIWIETTAQSGTTPEINVSLAYTLD